jgi:hypothetical protein
MSVGLSLGVMALGLVGVVLSMFFTDRELKAKYGYGGKKALAQGEKDGIIPKVPRLVSRISGAVLAIGTFFLVGNAF